MKPWFSLLAAVLLFLPSPQEPGGSLAGRVVLSGPQPEAKSAAPVKPADVPACGARVPDEAVQLGTGGGLRNVIVQLEGAGSSAAAPGKVRVTNRNCRFEPRVQTATVGETLVVGNDDGILHNTHAYLEGGATFFNVGLPFRGVEVARPLQRPGMIQFKCDAGHTWMSGYLLVLPHRLHATTDAAGNFRVAAVPPGQHRVRAWHERLGERAATVAIAPGREASVTIDFAR